MRNFFTSLLTIIALLIKNKSTASGGETPKGSAVSGVYRPHRDLWHTEGTLLSRSSWSRGDLVSAVGLLRTTFTDAFREQEPPAGRGTR